MTTTPICNPHICRVLLGTVRLFGVLWGAVGYWDLLGYAGGRGYRELLQDNGGTVGYCGVLGGTGVTGWCWGSKKITVRYCIVLLGTTRYSVVLGGTGIGWY